MRLITLGTGGAYANSDRTASATALVGDERVLLVDAGAGVAHRLAGADLAPRNVDVVLLTHHHYDHIGGLGDLLLNAWVMHRPVPVDIVGPPGTARIVHHLVHEVYGPDLRWRLAERAVAGAMDQPGVERPTLADPWTFARVTEVTSGVHEIGGWQVRAAESDHGSSLLAVPGWSSVAYRVERAATSVTFTGDTGVTDALIDLAHGTDLLVANCGLPGSRITTPFATVFTTRIIASAAEVGRLAEAAAVRSLVLTHLSPGMQAESEVDIRRSYAGPVAFATDLMTMDLPTG